MGRRAILLWTSRLTSANSRAVSKRAIIDVNSIVSGRNYDILTLIIAEFLMSLPFPDLSRQIAWDNGLSPGRTVCHAYCNSPLDYCHRSN